MTDDLVTRALGAAAILVCIPATGVALLLQDIQMATLGMATGAFLQSLANHD